MEHQVSAVRRMARMGSVLLADDMGLGKSLEALTAAAIDFEQGRARRALVIAPASLKANWHNENPDDPGEIQKFTNFTSVVLEGDPVKRSETLAEFDADILVVNYEQVKAHLDELNSIGFEVVIYDEAHYMKNHKAARTKACHKVRGRRHLLLTGSPVLNHVNELWSLLYRIAPGEFPRYWTFLHRYAVFGGYKDKEIVGVKNQAELKEKLNQVMIRRRFDDVMKRTEDQKPMIVQVEVDLSDEQKKLYKQAVEELEIDLPGEPTPMELENALTKFLRLKQIC
jgi:SNF2 family DNA or RNA helicase